MEDRSYSVLLDVHSLSNVDELISVLENGEHTMYQYDINEIPEFDSNEKRWELFQAPKAWEFITEDYRGFWDWIRESKNFKQLMWLSDTNTGPQSEHITAMTDNKNEFVQNRVYETTSLPHTAGQDLQVSARSMMNGKSKIMIFWLYYTVASGTTTYRRQLWILKYDPVTATMVPYIYPGSDERGYRVLPVNQEFYRAGPYFWACSEFSIAFDNDDELIEHAEASNTTPAGALSEREKFVFVIHRGAKPTRLVYGIDNKQNFTYQATALDEGATPIFTNAKETHMVTCTSTTRLEYINRELEVHTNITPNVALALPGLETKCTLSPDGTMFAWTDRTTSSPRLRIVRLSDGQVIYTSSINAACSAAVWTDSNVIFVNSITGTISRYIVSGSATQLFVQEVSNYLAPTTAGDYMPCYLESIQKILYVRRVAVSNQPLYYILDEITGRTDYIPSLSALTGVRIYYGAQSLMRRVPGHDNWFLIPTLTANTLILLKYNKATQLWSETLLTGAPTSTATDAYAQHVPVYFDNGTICAWMQHSRNDSHAVPIYDLNDGTLITTLPSQTWEVVRKLDESHLMYSGNTFTAIYEVDKVNRALIEK